MNKGMSLPFFAFFNLPYLPSFLGSSWNHVSYNISIIFYSIPLMLEVKMLMQATSTGRD